MASLSDKFAGRLGSGAKDRAAGREHMELKAV
jgi:hypothetical protein